MEEKHEHHAHHKKEGIKIKKSDLWKSAATILAILLVISVIINIRGGSGGGAALSAEQISEKVVSYITDNNLVQPGTTVEVTEVTEENSLYRLGLSIGGQKIDSYATKDGSLLFPNVFDMTEKIETPSTNPEPAAGIEKSDKPVVELFVMSHCPYGTQAEKGMIPVVELLGDKIDFELKFVNYAMHGEKEVTEQTRQYCINKEQNDKFLPYLKCFLKDGDSDACLGEAKIDTDKVTACKEAADTEFKITESLENPTGNFPAFLIYDAECNEYGIRGSPTLVINGATASSARSPAAYLATICAAFDDAPEECSQELSATTYSPGFGYEESGSANTASCG